MNTKQLRFTKWKLQLLPYLLVMTFPLGIVAANPNDLPQSLYVLIALVLSLIYVFIVDIGTRISLRIARIKPAFPLQTFLLMLLVFYCFAYGHLCRDLFRETIRHRYIFLAWNTLFIAAIVFICRYRRKIPLQNILSFANFAIILLLIMEIVTIGKHSFQHSIVRAPFPLNDAKINLQADSGNRPDVYYIILDGYARNDISRKYYHFDNSSFSKALRKRNFYIATQACTNYPMTFVSLSSSLNMHYMKELLQKDRIKKGITLSANDVVRLINNNLIARRFRKMGYRYRFVGSLWGKFAGDSTADEDMRATSILEPGHFFQRLLFSEYLHIFEVTTIVAPLRYYLGFFWDTSGFTFLCGKLTNKQFQSIVAPKQSNEPLFTFAHICCPHPPYIFDRNGLLPRGTFIEVNNTKAYYEQMLYLNKRVLRLIDDIQSLSGPETLIVLQADHGPALFFEDWLLPPQPTKRIANLAMGIFCAMRVPDKVRTQLYPRITPVNIFRIIFNNVFGDKWPVLQDRALYGVYQNNLHFTDISEVVGLSKP